MRPIRNQATQQTGFGRGKQIFEWQPVGAAARQFTHASGNLRHISGCGCANAEPATDSMYTIFASIPLSDYRRKRPCHGWRAICNDCRMPNLANLDRVAHKNLRVQEELAFGACKEITMCAVVLNEIPRLVIEYPLAFTKHGETGQYICVALFGVDPDRNLYWQAERWNSVTVPLNVGRQPFFVGMADNPAAGEGAKGLVTCIDLENPGVQTSAGEPLIRREWRRDSLSTAQTRAPGGTDRRRAEVACVCRSVGRSRSAAGRSTRAQVTRPPTAQDQRSVFDRREEVAFARHGDTRGAARRRLPARDVRHVVVARAPADPRAPRRRCADIGEYLTRLRAKEKAPATFVTGASLLGPWQ